jgi:hypothetical protein
LHELPVTVKADVGAHAEQHTSDSHLWSEAYERELQDIFALQDEIAGAVAAKLEVSLASVGRKSSGRVARPTLPPTTTFYGTYSWAWGIHALIVAIAGRVEESVAAAQHAMALARHSLVPQWSLLECLVNASRHREVLDQKDEALEISDRHPWVLASVAFAHAAVGEKHRARPIYDELAARGKLEYMQPATLACVAASGGLDVEAIEWVELAVKQCDPMLIFGQVLPGWSALRRLEAYDAVHAQLGLGQQKRARGRIADNWPPGERFAVRISLVDESSSVARTVIPGVRVLAMGFSSGQRTIFERA